MKSILKLALLATFLIIISCEKESIEEPLVENSTKFRAHVHSKKCRWVTRPLFNRLQSDQNLELGPLGGANFYGRYLPFGRVKGTSVNSSFVENADGTIDITSDDINNFTDGDQMFSITTIRFFPPTAETYPIAIIEGGSEITGGTGKFARATGHLTFKNMVFNVETGHESHRSFGKIRYRKCSRKRGY